MLLQILANTPKWVFALFAALPWLGLNQLLTRRLGLSRITLLAVGMAAFSFYGTVSAFSAVPTALFARMSRLSCAHLTRTGTAPARLARMARMTMANRRTSISTSAGVPAGARKPNQVTALKPL